jgi:hypothetical protein
MVEEVKELARFGMTNEEISEFFGIAANTWTKYMMEYPDLRAALEEGRLLDSLKVVASLHKQALGYVVTEFEEAEHLTKRGELVLLKKKSTKHILPNVTAAIYLLKTRHGDKWMDVVKHENQNVLNINIKNVDFSDVSNEELLMLKKLGIKRIPDEFTNKSQKAITQTIPVQSVRDN